MSEHVRDARKLDMAESLEDYRTPKGELPNRDQDSRYSWVFEFIMRLTREYNYTITSLPLARQVIGGTEREFN